MPSKNTEIKKRPLIKRSMTFGTKDKPPKLVLVCECGRKKTIDVDSTEVTIRVRNIDLGDNWYQTSHERPIITIPVNRLEWHCQHEDAK